MVAVALLESGLAKGLSCSNRSSRFVLPVTPAAPPPKGHIHVNDDDEEEEEDVDEEEEPS